MGILESVEEVEIINVGNFGSNIVYTPISNNIPIVDIKAFIEDAELGAISRDGKYTYDSRSFLSVALPSKPVKDDKIEFNGETWYVLYPKTSGKTLYDIECQQNKKSTHTTDKRGR